MCLEVALVLVKKVFPKMFLVLDFITTREREREREKERERQ